MSTSSLATVVDELKDWLAGQARWLQHAAGDILNGQKVDSETIKSYAKMALSESGGTLDHDVPVINFQSLMIGSGKPVKIQEISKISGIGQLKPRNPLKFGSTPLAVVYGANGSGKSSYVRILKQSCGARHKGDLHPDVFDGADVAQGCTLSYQEGGQVVSREWKSADGVVQGLTSVDIFDTHCGQSYLTSEGKASYEPRALQFLADLASLCDQVSALLQAEIDKRPLQLPNLPTDFTSTKTGIWYSNLSPKTKDEEIAANCSWTEADALELANLTKALDERSPEDRAKELRKKRDVAMMLCASMSEHIQQLSDEKCAALSKSRRSVVDAQKTAELAAKANLEFAVLEGVGSKQWSDLWAMARRYSYEIAYPGLNFPNLMDGARCVLCQQKLGEEGKKRLESFDRFVIAEASKALQSAKTILADALRQIPSLPADDILTAKCVGAGLDDALTSEILQFYADLRVRLAELILDSPPDEFSSIPDTSSWIFRTQEYADSLERKAKEYVEGANEAERSVKQAWKVELLARQWVAPQKVAVEAERERLGKATRLTKAQGLCKTRSISMKKDALATTLITPAYIDAFNRELSVLGAWKLRVELVKTKVSKGTILHQVKLRDAVKNRPIQEVLSEGEHRIVCLAAFLADSASNPNGSTFVFDDPISSLDLDYEENVVQRLVKLSSDRPVAVFTHRLSLLGMLRDYAKKAEVPLTMVTIKREPWGAGEPGDEAIEADAPKKGLNQHLPTRIAEAKAVYHNQGSDAYRPFAQSICTEVRKLIERMVEFELLADVVQRHRRAINTMGKLEKLASITEQDCTFIDRMMTKYSRFEHSQSAEAPVALPEPDELSDDIKLLKDWRDDLEKRRK